MKRRTPVVLAGILCLMFALPGCSRQDDFGSGEKSTASSTANSNGRKATQAGQAVRPTAAPQSAP